MMDDGQVDRQTDRQTDRQNVLGACGPLLSSGWVACCVLYGVAGTVRSSIAEMRMS